MVAGSNPGLRFIVPISLFHKGQDKAFKLIIIILYLSRFICYEENQIVDGSINVASSTLGGDM